MLLINVEKLIIESLFFSDENLSVDIDKFPLYKKIIVSGLPGSGKTSISNLLSEKFNAKVIDTDDIAKQLKSQNLSPPERFLKTQTIIWELLTNQDNIILCGVMLSRLYTEVPKFKQLFLKLPCIFLGKSALKSAWDAANRNSKRDNISLFKTLPMTLEWTFDTYYQREMKFKKDRTAIKNSNIQKL